MTVIELPLQTAARISFSTSLLEVNRKRAQRLMGILGIEALYPKPNLSRPAPGHEIYPYLLRGLSIERPNHVWSTDIMYIPMRGGLLYLVAVMDWFSRYALSWELSNHGDRLLSGGDGGRPPLWPTRDPELRSGFPIHGRGFSGAPEKTRRCLHLHSSATNRVRLHPGSQAACLRQFRTPRRRCGRLRSTAAGCCSRYRRQ